MDNHSAFLSVLGWGLTFRGSMAAGSWSISQVADLINRYKESTAQFKVDEAPVVSTFEGPDWADNWPEVRSQTGDIFFIPDWSSLGPHGVGQKLDLIDGACKSAARYLLLSGNEVEDPRSFLGCLA